jgi:diguanylate cyclase (GGDEF)-like protein
MDTWPPTLRRSLERQLVARFAMVFLLAALASSVLALVSYHGLVREEQRHSGDAALEHVAQRRTALLADWQRNAEQVKAQIDFMRVFVGADQTQNWLRLRAYFGALEGKLDRFPSGAVLDSANRVLFQFGPQGQALGRRLGLAPELPRWLHSAEQRAVYAVLAVPLWLGSQGMGRLVLLQPLDNSVLHQLGSPGISLFLTHREEVLASAGEAEEPGTGLSVDYSGRIDEAEGVYEQRSLSVFPEEPTGPRLILRQRVQQALSPVLVIASVLILLTLLALVLWLVLGRWIHQLTLRVGLLSRATALFAGEHAVGEPLQRALDAAQTEPDEISEVAQATRLLMYSVLQYDKDQFAYLQTLDMLEEAVVELGADGRYLRASPAWMRLASIDGQPTGQIYDHIHPDDVESLQQQLQQLVDSEKDSLSGRLRLRRQDNKELWIEYRFIRGTRRGGSVRGVLRDITQSYQLEKHVTHMALHDALTGLPNRVLLEDRCKMALRSAERSGLKVALGFLDLDHFKHVNDQFGHKTGDELLIALSAAMRKSLRSGDTLARWGGDEFVVLLTDLASAADVEDVIAKLASVCQTPIHLGDTEFHATFSMGVALYPDDARSVETLLSQADRAMFAAKAQGRNSVRFFYELVQREEDRRALYIQNRLSAAVREGKIQAWFQPIVDAHTQQVVGCEALARWRDDTYGWVPPATFVPMAENLGLIRELGQQVWRQAIEHLRRWRERGWDIRLSVNVSRRQLFTPTFTADLLADLRRLAIPVSAVDLEITESVAMEDAEHTGPRLAELSAAGFGISIDDFGTGYSSLSQLHAMPASKIKIDLSFVRRARSDQGRQLIQAIVKIASAFRLQTVAEGVETPELAAALAAQEVDLLQGNHFGEPMDAAAFERWLTLQLNEDRDLPERNA